MGIFYRENISRREKKSGKNDFAPSENYACYAPVGISVVPLNVR